MEAVWKKIGCAFTVHSTDSASHVDGAHGAAARAARMRSAWMSAEVESSFEH